MTTAPVKTLEALVLLDTEGLKPHAGLHVPWLSPPPAPRRPLTSCGWDVVGVEPPVQGVLEVDGRLPAVGSCVCYGKGETARHDPREGRGALSKRRLQRHTRPLSQARQHLPPEPSGRPVQLRLPVCLAGSCLLSHHGPALSVSSSCPFCAPGYASSRVSLCAAARG